ncbi:unnamed protein product [Moneuplotes crassus]|uniref:Uncharacterized protein n=1 Tax=Euplotes crassus TaxID=5936 RepID=A0AAD1U2P0_EUPCR|nr:unnamed protein product [Moneuplotes crassus]
MLLRSKLLSKIRRNSCLKRHKHRKFKESSINKTMVDNTTNSKRNIRYNNITKAKLRVSDFVHKKFSNKSCLTVCKRQIREYLSLDKINFDKPDINPSLPHSPLFKNNALRIMDKD